MNWLEKALVDKTLEKTGIVLNNANKPYILEYVNGRIAELHTSVEAYCSLLDTDPGELEKFINATTVNETYFFREELQFDFLSNVYFPSKISTPIRIWCGACSSGEEPLSVYALARQLGIKAEIQATDIDTEILKKFKKGTYEKNSFRTDGKKYHSLIHAISTVSGNRVEIKREALKDIKISQLNINLDTFLPFPNGCFDLIILRNAMIYFSKEHIAQLLEHLWNVLKDDGIILLSMNEIAAIEDSALFEKTKSGSVYYLKKKSSKLKKDIESQLKPAKAEERPILQKRKGHFHQAQINTTEIKTDGKTTSITEVYKEVFSCLNRRNYEKALKIIAETKFNVNELEYSFFLEGMVAYQKADYKNSEKLFYKSSKLNSDFWPAVMMLAFTYKNIGKTAKVTETFGEALNILDEYVKCGKVCYNFTIDFDPVYLLTLCKRNMEEAKQ